MAFTPGSQVLDLGCGAGRFARRLGSEASSYLGVDASDEMIRAARENCPDLAFREWDIVELDTDEASWDVILLMGNVLDYLQPYERRTRLMSRCTSWLRPGGKIVASSHLTKRSQPRGYYSEDYHGAIVQNYRASLNEIVAEAESQGFEVMDVRRDYRDGPADWCYWVGQLPS
jgi:2-polyprenyl-3-methyl-5-hydroxy-6-metoxy-1,4-benzoquinol methylase